MAEKLKILVSTKETQRQRKNDFCFVDEGEPVRLGFECDGEKVDGKCGCKRSLCGMKSHKSTTTMKVVELEMTIDDLTAMIQTSLESAGWLSKDSKKEGADWARKDAEALIRIANYFTAGTIIEKRGNKYWERRR